jgi:hypothetical protein
MFDLLKKTMFLMAEDAGGAPGGAAPAATPPSDTTPAPEPAANVSNVPAANVEPDKAPELPKFSSQLNPKKRESEDYKKYLYKHQHLDDVADDYVALNKRLEKAIEIPGKDAKPEDVKAFFKKLGVPEAEDGYELPMNGLDEKIAGPVAEQMRKEFMKSGMTKTQAKNMWNFMIKNYTVGTQLLQDRKDQQAQTFDARMAAKLEASHPVKAERDGAMQEAVNLFKQHISRTGLGKVYKDSGLIYNPDFVLAIAKEEKSRSGSSYVEGKPGVSGQKPIGAFGDNYSEDFKKLAGGR